MLTETEFARLLVSWKNQYGKEIKDRFCVPVERTSRMDMYKTLIKTLIELHGYTQSDFEGKTYRMVMEASIAANSDKKDVWRMSATADWNDALDVFFPSQLLQHDKATEPERKPRYEQVDEDPRLKNENLVDPSIVAGLPPVVDPVDEDFLKQLEEVGNE